jgi:hypothetical protein
MKKKLIINLNDGVAEALRGNNTKNGYSRENGG